MVAFLFTSAVMGKEEKKKRVSERIGEGMRGAYEERELEGRHFLKSMLITCQDQTGNQ